MCSGHFTSVGSAFINSSALLSLSISTTASKIKFICDFRGLIGQKGQKGHLFGPMFFPGRTLNFACKSRLNRKQVMHIKQYLFTKVVGSGVHLFIYGTKRAVFWIAIGTLRRTAVLIKRCVKKWSDHIYKHKTIPEFEKSIPCVFKLLRINKNKNYKNFSQPHLHSLGDKGVQLILYTTKRSAILNKHRDIKGWFTLWHKHKHKLTYADAVRCC